MRRILNSFVIGVKNKLQDEFFYTGQILEAPPKVVLQLQRQSP